MDGALETVKNKKVTVFYTIICEQSEEYMIPSIVCDH